MGRTDPKVHPVPPRLAQTRLAEAQKLHYRPGKVYKAQDAKIRLFYRVTHLLADLGWVDLDLGCSTHACLVDYTTPKS